ncbi:MAG: hypothetical protein KKB51_06525 [Candidatus Riflebacteria bacterium]|nr:hypothetical protein [Candidatus Riflebacteria bacterium]
MRVKCSALLFLILGMLPFSLGAVELKYKFRTGSTYEYDYTLTESSKVTAFTVNSTRSPSKTSRKFTLRAIDFQEGAYIIDVVSSEGTYRRYIRSNGALSGAPGETGRSVPFLLTFPEGDWKVSERHQVQQVLTIGATSVPVVWNLLLKSINSEKQSAEILFTLTIKLPEDRMRRKEFNLKGRAIFDFGEGVLQQAEWISGYSFVLANREMAVARDLWQFEHQNTGVLTLGTSED